MSFALSLVRRVLSQQEGNKNVFKKCARDADKMKMDSRRGGPQRHSATQVSMTRL